MTDENDIKDTEIQNKSMDAKELMAKYEDIIFNDEIKKRLPIEIYKKLMDRFFDFKRSFLSAKDKYKIDIRDNEEDAIYHQIWVLDIYFEIFSRLDDLSKSKKSDLLEIVKEIINEINIAIIIMCHDLIEDKDITFESLKWEYSEQNALSVLLISKPSIIHFIESSEEKEFYKKLKKKWIINKNGKISEKIRKKLHIIKYNLDNLSAIAIYWSEDYKLTKSEEKYYKEYEYFRKKYKKIRDDFYFENMKSLESMKNYALRLKKRFKMSLSNEELETACKNAIKVKICDRMQNLSSIVDAWKDTPERIEQKIEETEKKLLNIAREIWEVYYSKLKNYIDNTKSDFEKLSSCIKKRIWYTIWG